MDTSAKNKAHWNEFASTYNSRYQKTMDQIIQEIRARRNWIGVDWVEDNSDSTDEDEASPPPTTSSSVPSPKKTVRLLDYACGTGLVSRALAPYVTQTIGIDLAPNMVNEYNLAVSNHGIPESEMFAVEGNLVPSSSPSPSESICGPEFYDFDVAVVGLGFHHFDNPGLAAKRLAERLKKGSGVLVIIDFLPHEGHKSHGHEHKHVHSHGHGHSHNHAEDKNAEPQDTSKYGKANEKVTETIIHNGFSEDDMRRMFEEAGVGHGFEYLSVGSGVVFSKTMEDGDVMRRSVFMAKGRKA